MLGSVNSTDNITYSRHFPSAALAHVVQHYWTSVWDLPEEAPRSFEVLGHPNVQLHFEPGVSKAIGIHTRKVKRTLSGQGRVLGIKLRAGAFYALLQRPVRTLTNKTQALQTLLPQVDIAQWEAAILSPDIPEERVAAAEAFLLKLHLPHDPLANLMSELVDTLMQNHNLTRVEEIAALTGVGVRRLQRHFAQYIGVSPKWVLQRYRMHEALTQLQESPQPDVQQLVHALGYHDQAHFIRDFKAAVGQPPAAYTNAKG